MLGVASPAISYGSNRALIGVERGKTWSQNAQNVHFLYIHLGIVWVFLGSFLPRYAQKPYVGCTLGTLWVHFFEKVYLSWVQFGSFLGCFSKMDPECKCWVHFGYILGTFFLKSVPTKPNLGTLWVHFGYTLGTFLEKTVPIRPNLGTLWVHFWEKVYPRWVHF